MHTHAHKCLLCSNKQGQKTKCPQGQVRNTNEIPYPTWSRQLQPNFQPLLLLGNAGLMWPTLQGKPEIWTSLVVQWLGIHLPTWGMQVPSLVWGDSTSPGAAGPMCCNCWSPGALEPMLCNKRSMLLQPESSPHLPQLEKALTQQWSTAKNTSINKNFSKREAWNFNMSTNCW